MATQFHLSGDGVTFTKFDASVNQWVPSNEQEYKMTRTQEKAARGRGVGGPLSAPTPAKDISPPSAFARGRETLIKGLTTPLFGKTDTPGARRGKAFLNFVLPETPGATSRDAIQTALAFLPGGKALSKGPQVLKAVSKFLRTPGRKAVARIVAPPIGAGLVAGATGGEPGKEAAIAAGGSFAELLGIPIRKSVRSIAKMTSAGKIAEVEIDDLGKINKAFSKAVPSFKEIIKTEGRAALATLADPDQGRATLSKVFARSDARIKKAFGKQKISIEKAPIRVGTAVQAPISVADNSLTAGQLLQKVKDLKEAARGLPFGSQERRIAQADANKFQGVLKNALKTKDLLNKGRNLKSGSLLAGYNKGVREFRQGLPLLDLAKAAVKSGAVRTSPTGFVLDQPKFTKLLETTRGITAKKFPDLFAATSRGNVRGAADEIKETTVRTLARGVAALNLPLPPRVTRAGTAFRLGPGRAQLPASLSASRLFGSIAGTDISGNPTDRRSGLVR